MLPATVLAEWLIVRHGSEGQHSSGTGHRVAGPLCGFVFLSGLVFLVLGCGDVAERCDIAAPEGPVVMNDATGAWEGEVSLHEVWRVGGLAEGQEFLRPAALAVNEGGRVAVADFGLGEVLLIAPDGRWEGPVATSGEGPGDVQVPVAVAWKGNRRLLVLDLALARITELDVASGASETRRLSQAFVAPVLRRGQIRLAAMQPDGTAWLELPGEDLSTGWETRTYAREPTGAGGMERIVHTAVRVVGEGKYRYVSLPGWPRVLLGVGPSGWVLSDSSERYELKFFDRDGRVVAHTCYPDESAERPEGDWTSYLWDGAGEADGPPDDLLTLLRDAELPANPAPISRLLVDSDGRVWVQRDLPKPWDGFDTTYGVAGATHDVFSATGAYLGSVTVPPGHRLQAARGDRLWTFIVGDLDEFSVAVFDMLVSD